MSLFLVASLLFHLALFWFFPYKAQPVSLGPQPIWIDQGGKEGGQITGVIARRSDVIARRSRSKLGEIASPSGLAMTTGQAISFSQLSRWGNRAPTYPLEAAERRWEGRLRVQLQFDANGKISDLLLLESSGHPILDEAALDAAKGWAIPPDEARNVSTLIVPIEFKLVD